MCRSGRTIRNRLAAASRLLRLFVRNSRRRRDCDGEEIRRVSRGRGAAVFSTACLTPPGETAQVRQNPTHCEDQPDCSGSSKSQCYAGCRWADSGFCIFWSDCTAVGNQCILWTCFLARSGSENPPIGPFCPGTRRPQVSCRETRRRGALCRAA